MSGIIKSFDFHGSALRVIADADGQLWFVANEVATLLGYAKPRDAVGRHCKGAVKRGVPTQGGVQSVNVIPEPDLYRLVMRSELPSAERFEEWVVGEVLPSIRRTGSYQKGGLAPADSKLAIRMSREKRLMMREERLQREQVRRDVLDAEAWLNENGHGDHAAIVRLQHIHLTTGHDIRALQSTTDATNWRSASEIGATVEDKAQGTGHVSGNAIGKIAKGLGFQTDEAIDSGHVRRVPTHVPGRPNKPVHQWQYDESVTDVIISMAETWVAADPTNKKRPPIATFVASNRAHSDRQIDLPLGEEKQWN